MATWQKRYKREDTKYAERRAWYTTCKRFKVIEIDILYGNGKDEHGNPTGYPVTYEARAQRENGVWHLISEHRKYRAAVSAINYLADKGKARPKRTKSAKAVKRQQAKRKAKKDQRSG